MEPVLGRFFRIVWVAIGAIVASWFRMLLEVGFAQAPRSWHVMAGVGLAMAAVFASIWFGPWRGPAGGDGGQLGPGAKAMNGIRQRVTLNLILGTLTVALATLGLAF